MTGLLTGIGVEPGDPDLITEGTEAAEAGAIAIQHGGWRQSAREIAAPHVRTTVEYAIMPMVTSVSRRHRSMTRPACILATRLMS